MIISESLNIPTSIKFHLNQPTKVSEALFFKISLSKTILWSKWFFCICHSHWNNSLLVHFNRQFPHKTFTSCTVNFLSVKWDWEEGTNTVFHSNLNHLTIFTLKCKCFYYTVLYNFNTGSIFSHFSKVGYMSSMQFA